MSDSPNIQSIIEALRNIVKSYDEAKDERYDEMKWDAFNSKGEIEDARAILRELEKNNDRE